MLTVCFLLRTFNSSLNCQKQIEATHRCRRNPMSLGHTVNVDRALVNFLLFNGRLSSGLNRLTMMKIHCLGDPALPVSTYCQMFFRSHFFSARNPPETQGDCKYVTFS